MVNNRYLRIINLLISIESDIITNRIYILFNFKYVLNDLMKKYIYICWFLIKFTCNCI